MTNQFFNWMIVLVPGLDMVSAPLSPLRSAVFDALREPLSATEVAARLGESRQRVNYHVRELERARVSSRSSRSAPGAGARAGGARDLPRRARRADRLGSIPEDQDRFAADALLEGSARMVRDVAAARRRPTGAASAC